MKKLLTIGMATYDDFDGTYFTIQSLRMHHSVCMSADVEFIVIDTNPEGTHSAALKKYLCSIPNARYIPFKGVASSFNKYEVALYAFGKYVIIMDCHVLLSAGSIDYLLDYYNKNADCRNLIQGPLLHDNLVNVSTEMKPEWNGSMLGVWHTSQDKYDKGEPFEINMQGMGLCSFENKYWPGVHKMFKGFGAEEGYVHKKIRKNKGKCICLPKLKWAHRFGRPAGVKYPLCIEDRIFNYFLGVLDVTEDLDSPELQAICKVFEKKVPEEELKFILMDAKNAYRGIGPKVAQVNFVAQICKK